jgi:hypothetical protein
LKEKKVKRFITPSLAKGKGLPFKRRKLVEKVEKKRAKLFFVSFGL